MARSIFVGDKIRTPDDKIAFVDEVNTWRDRVEAMIDAEAIGFSEKCCAEVGRNFREDWVEIFCMVGKKRRRYLSVAVEVLESRDEA